MTHPVTRVGARRCYHKENTEDENQDIRCHINLNIKINKWRNLNVGQNNQS